MFYIPDYTICYLTCYRCAAALQPSLLPQIVRKAQGPGVFTAIKHIMQDFTKEKKLDATFIYVLIQKVLSNP